MNSKNIGVLCAVWCVFLFQTICAAQKHITLNIEAEKFQYKGSWIALEDRSKCSGKEYLFAGERGAEYPAVTAVEIPKAGTYYLWVRARDFASDRPGTRTFAVDVNGVRSKELFGNSLKDGFHWEPGGAFELAAGKVLLSIHDVSKAFGRVDAILLTTDPDFKAVGKAGAPGIKRLFSC